VAAEELRKEYQKLVRRKKGFFSKARTAQLAKRDPKGFWERFKSKNNGLGWQANRSGLNTARSYTRGVLLQRGEVKVDGERF
jgi:hypothetical protein